MAPPPEVPLYRVGEWVPVGKYHMIVHEVREAWAGALPWPVALPRPTLPLGGLRRWLIRRMLRAEPPPLPPTSPPARLAYLDVGYDNRTSETLGVRMAHWHLQDAAGYRLRTIFAAEQRLAGRGMIPLREGAVAPGRQVRGWVAFELPPGYRPHYIHLMDGYFMSNVADVIYAESEAG